MRSRLQWLLYCISISLYVPRSVCVENSQTTYYRQEVLLAELSIVLFNQIIVEIDTIHQNENIYDTIHDGVYLKE